MSMGSVKDTHTHWGTEGRIFSSTSWMRKLKANSSDELPKVPQLLRRVAEVKVMDPTARLPRFVLTLLLSWASTWPFYASVPSLSNVDTNRCHFSELSWRLNEPVHIKDQGAGPCHAAFSLSLTYGSGRSTDAFEMGVPINCYGKTWRKFLANPIFLPSLGL